MEDCAECQCAIQGFEVPDFPASTRDRRACLRIDPLQLFLRRLARLMKLFLGVSARPRLSTIHWHRQYYV